MLEISLSEECNLTAIKTLKRFAVLIADRYGGIIFLTVVLMWSTLSSKARRMCIERGAKCL
jgi:hypothetical protein